MRRRLALAPVLTAHLISAQNFSVTNESSDTKSGRTWAFATVLIAVLAVVNWTHEILARFPAYRGLYKHHAFYVPESIDKLEGVLLCAVAVCLLRRVSWKGVAREFGLATSPLPGLAFGLVASLPMLVGFALTRTVNPHMQPLNVIFLAVFSPVVEEIEFRGFGLRSLQRGTGWRFWAIVWPQAALFGMGHIEKGQNFAEVAGLLFLVGSGGVVFGWLVYRWQSLWFPISLHILMNLWWEVFTVSNSAIGGWFPFALQIVSIPAAIAITLLWNRRREYADSRP